MAEKFYTILTSIGLAKIANSQVTGNKVNLVEMAVGDGNGTYYNPTSNDVTLRNEKWRGPIGSVEIDEDNANWIVIETVIPSEIGGFFLREVGLFDEEGDLIAIGKYPETYKPVLDEGSAKDLYIRMIIEVSNASAVTLKVDPTVIIASRKYVDEKIALAVGPIYQSLEDLETLIREYRQDLASHLADYTYQDAGGTATAITLTINNLSDGYPVTFIASSNNNGASTTINGKQLYKPNASIAPNLVAGKAYTVWYSQNEDCFFIKASAEGTASVADVLAGNTFSNDDDTGLLGTMPNQKGDRSTGITSATLAHSTNGSGIFVNVPKGAYLEESVRGNPEVFLSDPNFHTRNIVSGVSIFGVNGSFSGKKWASGTVTSALSKIAVRGLDFQPSICILKDPSNDDSSFNNRRSFFVYVRKSVFGLANDIMVGFNQSASNLTLTVNAYSDGIEIQSVDNYINYNWIAFE